MSRSDIQLTPSGSTKGLERFLKMAGRTDNIVRRVDVVAKAGLVALIAATPKDSGLTVQVGLIRFQLLAME